MRSLLIPSEAENKFHGKKEFEMPVQHMPSSHDNKKKIASTLHNHLSRSHQLRLLCMEKDILLHCKPDSLCPHNPLNRTTFNFLFLAANLPDNCLFLDQQATTFIYLLSNRCHVKF
ncbi:hypothetical protein OIU78_001448 [Salix suchowensis]|nr:hypothetical protein OIU78_001448 [Salix suchowensis]